MKISIDLNPKYKEEEIVIRASELSPKVTQIIRLLEEQNFKHIIGFKEQRFHLLEPSDIYFFYAEERKVYANTTKGIFEIKSRLYELENQLKNHHFVRFSKSVIGNLRHVESFEIYFNGSMCARFSNGMKEYVTRRYVPLIKETLQIGGTE